MKTHRILSALLIAVMLVAAFPVLALAQATGPSTDLIGRLSGNGGSPVLSTCGTAPSIVGDDTAGQITIGTGTPSACTITFARAWPNGVVCFVQDNTTAAKNPVTVVYAPVLATAAPIAVTAVTVTFAAATVNGDLVQYLCNGFGR